MYREPLPLSLKSSLSSFTPFLTRLSLALGLVFFVYKQAGPHGTKNSWSGFTMSRVSVSVCVRSIFCVVARVWRTWPFENTLPLSWGAFILSSLFCVRATFSLQEAALACTKGHVMCCNAVFLGRGRVCVYVSQIDVTDLASCVGGGKKLWRRSLRADRFLSDL